MSYAVKTKSKSKKTLLCCHNLLHGKMTKDGKEKPKIIKFFDFTKGGTGIVISWMTITLQEILSMGYGGSLSHAWHFQDKWKDHLVLETQRRYFKVHINTTLDGILPKLWHYFMFIDKNCMIWCHWFSWRSKCSSELHLKSLRYECTGKRKKYTRIIVEVRVKKITSQCPQSNASHVVKVLLEHILREFGIHVYSDILHWYKVFDEKVFLRKENSSVLLLTWKMYSQFFQMILKLSDHNMLEKDTNFFPKSVTPFPYKAIASSVWLKIRSELSIV